VKFYYSFPIQPKHVGRIAVEVQVPYLLDFFRYCKATDKMELMHSVCVLRWS
jgi:hypothetical protein